MLEAAYKLMLKVVLDTNLWLRILMGGAAVNFIASARAKRQLEIVSSEALLAELDEVRQRPKLRVRINEIEARELTESIRNCAIMTELHTTPPYCRDPKDNIVLATAIDGGADVIVSSDGDLRDDEALQAAMKEYGIEIWGIEQLRRVINP